VVKKSSQISDAARKSCGVHYEVYLRKKDGASIITNVLKFKSSKYHIVRQIRSGNSVTTSERCGTLKGVGLITVPPPPLAAIAC
ncbi:MAG: hypothetical protein ACK5X3_15825, partial [Pseudomonadota bacterium]